MMNRQMLAAACAVVLLLLVGIWWGTRAPSIAPALSSGVEAAPPSEPEVDAVLEGGARSAVDRATATVAAPEPPSRPAAPAEPAASAPAAVELPPKDALGELIVHVTDKQSARGVPDARLRMYMLRRGDEPGSAYFWPEEIPAEAVTDATGTARLSYPAWVAGLGLTSTVAFMLEHAEYPSRREEFEITGLRTEHSVELEYGGYLMVSGWIGDPTQVVRDVEVTTSQQSAIRARDWIAGRDGRLATNRAKPGPHALSIGWTSPQGQRYESRVLEFELAAGEQRELSLELLPALRLRGRLDLAVPRPIVNGDVVVCAVFGARGDTTGLRLHGAKVAADGTFEIVNLPPARIELIAMCDGWAATYELEPYRYEYEVPGQSQKQVAEGESWSIPTFEAIPEAELVVPMTPTAAVELELVDEAGAPIAGASFAMWPNVHWPTSGYSQIYLDRDWSAMTDVAGRARLENLPAHLAPCEESYRVSKGGYEPVEDGRDGGAEGQVAIEPGGVARLRIVMRAKQN